MKAAIPFGSEQAQKHASATGRISDAWRNPGRSVSLAREPIKPNLAVAKPHNR